MANLPEPVVRYRIHPGQISAARLVEGSAANVAARVADAIRAGQDVLMAKPETSHPYYWAGFAIVGDGAQAVLTAQR